MSIPLHCGRCDKKFSAARTMAGRRAPCPQCKSPVMVPAGAARSTARPASDDSLIPLDDDAPYPAVAAETGVQEIFDAETVHEPAFPHASPNSRGGTADPPYLASTPIQPTRQAAPAKPVNPARSGGSGWGVVLAVVGVGLLVVLGLGGFAAYQIVSAFRGFASSMDAAMEAAVAEGSQEPFVVPKSPLPHFPPRPAMRRIEAGVEFAEVRLPVGAGPGRASRLYLYLPSGSHRPRSLGCIFVAPAGATSFSGMGLASEDQPEHLPYVKAGFAVVAYEVDGELPDGDYVPNFQIARAYNEYRASMAGLINARNAIEYALARMAEIDPNRLYAAGHSSAGRQALLLAEHEPRLKAVVAYNAVTDVVEDMAPYMAETEPVLPGLRDFLTRSSPLTHVSRLQCAVRIFHSEGDERVPVDQARRFFAKLPSTAQPRELHIVPGGDHYNPMIRQGVPAAVTWLKGIDQRLGGSSQGAPPPLSQLAGGASSSQTPSEAASPTITVDATPDSVEASQTLDPTPPGFPPGFGPPGAIPPGFPPPFPSIPPPTAPTSPTAPPTPTMPPQIAARIKTIAISDSGKLAACGDMGGSVHVWDPQTKQEIGSFRVFERGWIDQLAVNDEGLVAAAGGFPRTTELWNARTQERIAQLDQQAAESLAFSPDGTTLAVGLHRSVRLVNAGDGKEIRRWERDGYATAVAFSEDGGLLASGWRYGTTVVWRLAEPDQPIFERATHDMNVMGLSFSSDGRKLLTCARDGKLGYWDLWKVSALWEARGANFDRVRVLPGDEQALAWRGGRLEVWSLGTGERIGEERPDPRAHELVLSRDGRQGVFYRFGGAGVNDVNLWRRE